MKDVYKNKTNTIMYWFYLVYLNLQLDIPV